VRRAANVVVMQSLGLALHGVGQGKLLSLREARRHRAESPATGLRTQWRTCWAPVRQTTNPRLLLVVSWPRFDTKSFRGGLTERCLSFLHSYEPLTPVRGGLSK
jgi:hypothetical protein